jgi:hypothetical protein
MKRSSPLSVDATGVGLAVSKVGVAVGDGEVSGDGDSDGCGVGLVASGCRVKLAQGFGWTLAHRWWTPGESPEKGLTLVVKFPFESALEAPATFDGWSQ